MVSKNPTIKGMERIPDDPDLLIISSYISFNGELCGPILGVPSSTVEQIKTANVTTLMRTYRLLKVWHERRGAEATIESLFSDLEGALDALNIDSDGLKGTFFEDSNVDDEFSSTLFDRLKSKSYIPPKKACIYDGRLIRLYHKDIEDLRKNNTIKIGEGSGGKVFKSEKESEGFGMHVVVKKIPLEENKDQNRSIMREMMASRIMHPFILPLLAVVDRPNGIPEVWFVSPLYSKGDLNKVIKDKGQKLNKMTRVKIMLQIALAIQYIHTKVPNVRDIILHKDISSKNVVLDDRYNARLIDFGLAREKDDITIEEGGRDLYAHPDIGNGNDSIESWDYFAYGVIMREMLTSLGPEGKSKKYLKKMTVDEVERHLDRDIWKSCESEDTGKQLTEMTGDLLEKNWTVEDFEIEVVEKLRKIWKKSGRKILELSNDDKCHICMINYKAEETSMTQEHTDNCNQKILMCIACEKNSFLNPITCFCGTVLSPLIGNGWGALLVAGKDTNNKRYIESMAKDVKEIENLITSKAPRIIGISKANIRTVISDEASNEDRKNQEGGEKEEQLWHKVKDNISSFSERKDIHTLLIYFSCHGAKSDAGSGDGKENLFQIGSAADSISLQDFQTELERLNNIKKLIIILDRCFPPSVHFKDVERKYFQINSCKSSEKASLTYDGSTFTKYFIRALKAKSVKSACHDNCEHCNKYWHTTTNFITVSSLFNYLEGHLQKQNQNPEKIDHLVDEKFAYYTDEEVHIDFKEGDSKLKTVPIEYLQDMAKLKEKLLKDFNKEVGVNNVHIERQTYRKDRPLEVCDTLEKVMHAWVHRQPLKVTFKSE